MRNQENQPESAAFKVGMVLIVDTEDGGWGSVGYSGLQRIGRNAGMSICYRCNVAPAQWEPAFIELANQGCQLVLGHGGELSGAARAAAGRFPQVMFACLNGDFTASNLASLSLRDEQVAYLAGSLAAMMSQTHRVGFIGGLEIPPTLRQGSGFECGARARGASVSQRFTGDFSDADQARKAARGLIADGADVLYYYLNDAWKGVFQACRETGAHVITSVVPRTDFMPELIYANARQDVGSLYLMATRLAQAGEMQGRYYHFGVEDPAIQGLTGLHNVPEGVARELEDIRKSIVSGEISIPENPSEPWS